MNFNETVIKLEKYLHSIRKLKTYLSIDLIFPPNWVFPKSIIDSTQVVQNEGPNNTTITSFVSSFKDSNKIVDMIFKIINYNLELEEKERLLKMKVAELKEIFKSNNLDALKTLEITVPEYEEDIDDTLFIDESEESTEGIGVVE
jgi:hypothetical protein